MRLTLLSALAASTVVLAGAATAQEHFDPKGKPPSEQTIAYQQNLRETLNFADTRDFEENARGFIAAPDFGKIMADAGNVAWDMESYGFLLTDEEFTAKKQELLSRL